MEHELVQMAFAKRWLFARRDSYWAVFASDMDSSNPRVLKAEVVGDTGMTTEEVDDRNVVERWVLSAAYGCPEEVNDHVRR